MVLYDKNGQPMKKHEEHLEKEAKSEAKNGKYDDQISIAKSQDRKAIQKDCRVRIVVDNQPEWNALYNRGIFDDELEGFTRSEEFHLPDEGLDRATLMKCSSLADEFFRFNPGEEDLHLPVSYPRRHLAGLDVGYGTGAEYQMAHIRPDEIQKYIVPWLRKMEKGFKSTKAPRKGPSEPGSNPSLEGKQQKKDIGTDQPNGSGPSGLPSHPKRYEPTRIDGVTIPDDLLEKIHLYNAMLQLGLPSFIQRPLIDSLVAQMYKEPLNKCHLETLEMTVGRFCSGAVAILDPVLNHFIGTYAFRTLDDRANPSAHQQDKGSIDPVYGAKRDLLSYRKYFDPMRKRTFTVPPKLPVLGHSIRHWSGVRRNGNTVAAFTGYPLNVGRVKKFYRTSSNGRVLREKRNRDFVEYSTYRLRNDENYRRNVPGTTTQEVEDVGERDHNDIEKEGGNGKSIDGDKAATPAAANN